jgi:hypothetical protein
MHPAINREVSVTRTADFREQARRDATVRLARELRAHTAEPRQSLLGRIITQLAQRIPALAGARKPRADDGT